MNYRPRSFRFLLLLCCLLFPACGQSRIELGFRPNVLLVVLDTVRADRLSSYGFPRETTPHLDSLAEDGILFSNFFSNASWTLPSHASLFTGLYPVGHRATQETGRFDKELPTLAEILGTEGYRTLAASANPVVSRALGLDRGFDEFREVFRSERATYAEGPRAHRVNRVMAEFLESESDDRPFFVFLNYIEAHLPYVPPDPVASRFLKSAVRDSRQLMRVKEWYASPQEYTAEEIALLGRLYDSEIAYLDELIASLVEILREAGQLEETLLIITSDHGENIGEHGHFGHRFSLGNTLLRIPLIVRLPGGEPGGSVRDDSAQMIDLFPTILSLCGVSYQGRFDGRDLFDAGASSVETPAIAEYYYPFRALSALGPEVVEQGRAHLTKYMRRLRSVQDSRTKFVWSSDGNHELYRIDRDPGENENLFSIESPGAGHDTERFLRMLDDFVARYEGTPPLPPAPPPGTMEPGFEETIEDPEHLERLRSLGYVN